MANQVIEASYPIAFREKDAISLGEHLKSRHSVVLIGMKRVGISNFLRFFLNHKDIALTYLKNNNSHLFIPVDLNDLVEKEAYPFWILTLKRIVDAAQKFSKDQTLKKSIEDLFLDSIQSKDTFKTLENLRKALVHITEASILPTIFFIRFDRLKDMVTPELFGNLQGLKDVTHHKLAYVFTSFRSLDGLSSLVFPKSALSVFAQDLYVKPARRKDIEIIFDSYKDRYKLSLTEGLKESLFELVDGYVQYLQLALIALHENNRALKSKDELFDFLSKDERVTLQSEELWESLNSAEQNILLKIEKGQGNTSEERKLAAYLWDTGFITEAKKDAVFSPLFSHYLKQRQMTKGNSGSIDLSKKEHMLFTFLKSKIGTICEREEIIQGVWPEVEEFGVSDWAIDRLVARLRVKLRAQNAKFEIQTVKTRGYKMVEI